MEGKSKQTIALERVAVTGIATPISETGLDVFVVGEHADDPNDAPFRLLDMAGNTVKADVDLAGAQFGQVREAIAWLEHVACTPCAWTALWSVVCAARCVCRRSWSVA